MTTRIVIADDHPMVVAALRSALATAFSDLEVIGAPTVKAAIRAIGTDATSTDLVLLDLSLPDARNFSGLLLLLAQYPTLPVAVISAEENPATIRRCMDYGACGYLPKSLDLSDLANAVRAILDGDIWTPANFVSTDGVDDGEADMVHRFSSLSAQQIRILLMIAEGKLNKQIAADLRIAEQTVKIHISAIFRKLGVSRRAQAAVIAQKLTSRA